MLHALSKSSSAVERVGKYRVLGRLGEGGMAEVFLGTADNTPGFHKLLVLKLLRESLAEDPHCVTMFLDEARLAARLGHRNVVQTYEVGQAGTRYAIVMEYLEGTSFGRLRRLADKANEPLPVAAGLHVLAEALTGLHYAHELPDYDGKPLDIVHRDFTPNNLYVTLDGQVKVLDFGIAKTRANVSETRTGMFKGTVRYMAPEALLASKVDRRADVYMAGAILWEVLTAQRMWAGKEDIAIMHAAASGEVVPPSEVAKDVPPELEEIAMRALAKEPGDRFPTALAMRDALRAAMDTTGLRFGVDQLADLVERHAGETCRALRTQVARELASDELAVADRTSPSVASLDAPPTSPSQRSVATAEPQPPPASRPPVPRALAIGGGVIVLALAAYALAPRDSAAPTQTLPIAGAVSVTPAPLEAQREAITVRVAAHPASAVLELDGRALEGNPVEVQAPRDGEQHVLRASAPGHDTQTIHVRFDRDVQAALTLNRHAPRASETPARQSASRASAPSRRRDAPVPSAAATPPPAVAEPAPVPAAPRAAEPERQRESLGGDSLVRRTRAPREIDTENPFGD